MIEQIVTVPAGAKGVDFAGWRPTAAELHGLGLSFVMPYVAIGGTWKRPAVAEMQVYLAAGIAVSFLAEQDPDSWTQGYAKGLAHGKSGATVAAAMGYPTTLSITAAWDTYVAPGDQRALDYGNGFADGVEPGGYRLGVYGGLPVIRMMQARSAFNFLAGAAGWSAPKVNGAYDVAAQPDYGLVHVRQVISGSTPNYDNDITLRPFPAWLPHESVEPPIEVLPTSPEVDMRAFTHSDNDHDGHPPRWTFWCYETGGTKRHILGHELTILGGPDAAPAISMAEIDLIPDYVAPGPSAPVTHLSGSWSTS